MSNEKFCLFLHPATELHACRYQHHARSGTERIRASVRHHKLLRGQDDPQHAVELYNFALLDVSTGAGGTTICSQVKLHSVPFCDIK